MMTLTLTMTTTMIMVRTLMMMMMMRMMMTMTMMLMIMIVMMIVMAMMMRMMMMISSIVMIMASLLTRSTHRVQAVHAKAFTARVEARGGCRAQRSLRSRKWVLHQAQRRNPRKLEWVGVLRLVPAASVIRVPVLQASVQTHSWTLKNAHTGPADMEEIYCTPLRYLQRMQVERKEGFETLLVN